MGEENHICMYCGKPLDEDGAYEICHRESSYYPTLRSVYVTDGYACEECNTIKDDIERMEDELDAMKDKLSDRKGTYNIGL